ncbi:hypothetical protein ACKWTF_008966 [Chironomus riparius]
MKMNKKIIVTICAVIIYAILFVYVTKNVAGQSECGNYFQFCIRFCSADTETFSDDFLLDEFLKSEFGKSFKNLIGFNFNVFRGFPVCGELKYFQLRENSTSPFSPLGNVVMHLRKQYNYKKYCLEKSDDVQHGWKIMICQRDVYFYKIFHFIAISCSVLLFGSIIFVYSYFKELRDFHGKFTIVLMVPLICAYIVIPLAVFDHDEQKLFRGYFGVILPMIYTTTMMMILLWITAMILHSFLTFKNFKQQVLNQYDFSIFVAFVLTFIIFSAFLLVWERISDGNNNFILYLCMLNNLLIFKDSRQHYLYVIYFFIGFIDIILLIITGIKVLIVSRHLTHSEQPKFDTERKWYWITVKLSLIMLVTWKFVFITWEDINYHLLTNFISDFVMIFTAVIISIILLGRKQVKILLFGKYHAMLNVEA